MTAYVSLYGSVAGIQAKSGLSNTEIDLTDDNIVRATLEDAENELEMLCGRKFTSANSITEYLSIKEKDIVNNSQTTIQLNHYPIQSISVFQQLDSAGTATSTYAALTSIQIAAGTVNTADYWLQTQNDPLTNQVIPNGKISLVSQSFPRGTNNVKVTYTYGYTTVPVPVRDLANCLAAIRCWVRFIGASYNRLNSYQIPEQVVNKGDFYQRGAQNIQMLTDEANRLLDRVGKKPRSLFFSSGDSR